MSNQICRQLDKFLTDNLKLSPAEALSAVCVFLTVTLATNKIPDKAIDELLIKIRKHVAELKRDLEAIDE